MSGPLPLPNNSSKSESLTGSSVGLGLLATGLTLGTLTAFEGLLMTRTRPGAGLKPTASGSTPARTNS